MMNNKYLAAVLFCLTTLASCAEESPAVLESTTTAEASPETVSIESASPLFDVVGVAADDVLNMRASPDSQSAIVGELPSDAKGISALVTDGQWIKVEYQGATGWAHSRFLQRRENRAIPIESQQKISSAQMVSDIISEELFCIGTEPHWNLKSHQASLQFTHFDEQESLALAGATPLEQNGAQGWRFILENIGDTNQTFSAAIVADESCSDDMSDDSYRYAITVKKGEQTFTGCCNPQR